MTPTAIAVLDGLTAPRDLDEPGCQHGVPWYVGQLGPALLARLSDSTASLQDCLSSAIADVAARHCFCDLTSPGAPQSTVALVRVRGDELEWLVLADSVIVVDLHGELRVISDDRVERAAQVQRDDALRSPVGTAEHDQSVRRLIQQQRSVRNQPGGYWVAAADPAVAHEALTGSAHLSKVRSVAVLSDGAARLVEFGLAGWDQVLSTLAEAGPQSLINEIRRVEATDLRGDHWPRYKTSDDATAVYARF
ncbi:MAG: protein phosphatase 2C domain-containing protein [Pseudonocardiales bacterium]|nr:protein phosphatase 2C domain-containing protein [Pseudonocardiales bacterium]